MPFPQQPTNFTLYNYTTGTAVIDSVTFTDASGMQHRADLSNFGGALGSASAFTGTVLGPGLGVSVPASSSVPFVLDYTTSTVTIGTYLATVAVAANLATLGDVTRTVNNTLVISTTPQDDPTPGYAGDGGGEFPPVQDGGEPSAGGGGTKVICTALYDMGYMPKDIFEHDQAFGRWLRENNPVAYRGYRVWADVLVSYVRGERLFWATQLLFWKTREQQMELTVKFALLLARFIGSTFAGEIARRAGHPSPFTLTGWVIVSGGLKICKLLGYIFKPNKKLKVISQ
jgi:hypothetical protein